MIVKICGLRTLEHAKTAVKFGADCVGFTFAAHRRRIEPALAREIISSLPLNVRKVGIFVNQDPADVRQIAQEAGLDVVQLCGDESPEDCRKVGVPFAKSLRVRGREVLDEIDRYVDDAEWIVLDGFKEGSYGGSGTSFDWTVAHEAAARARIMLAGGLTPDNVQTAILLAHPWGVDVSSGVETDGVKDIAKIQAFIRAAREG